MDKDSVWIESVKTSAPYLRPVARDARLEWIALTNDQGPALWRIRVDAPSSPELVQGPDGYERFAIAASETMTLVGTVTPGGLVEIEAFTR